MTELKIEYMTEQESTVKYPLSNTFDILQENNHTMPVNIIFIEEQEIEIEGEIKTLEKTLSTHKLQSLDDINSFDLNLDSKEFKSKNNTATKIVIKNNNTIDIYDNASIYSLIKLSTKYTLACSTINFKNDINIQSNITLDLTGPILVNGKIYDKERKINKNFIINFELNKKITEYKGLIKTKPALGLEILTVEDDDTSTIESFTYNNITIDQINLINAYMNEFNYIIGNDKEKKNIFKRFEKIIKDKDGKPINTVDTQYIQIKENISKNKLINDSRMVYNYYNNITKYIAGIINDVTDNKLKKLESNQYFNIIPPNIGMAPTINNININGKGKTGKLARSAGYLVQANTQFITLNNCNNNATINNVAGERIMW